MIRRAVSLPVVLLALVTSTFAACYARGGTESEASAPRSRSAPVDADRPLQGLHLAADAVAARVGSFAWEGDVTWSVERPGVAPVRATERHRIRQLATGDFESSVEIDPGGGPGSETGRTVIWKGGQTYARGRWAPYRERPTDRGEGARRVRDESFRMVGDVADLLGASLAVRPSGTATLHGRHVRRFELSLATGAAGATPTDATKATTVASPGTVLAPAGAAADARDPDTARRRAFLEGRRPTAVAGELLVDAATGVPMSATVRASFTEAADAQLKADVSLDVRVSALGRDVAAIHAPQSALPDDRKPKGVARALEAAGLRKRGVAPSPEGEDEVPDEAP